MSARLKMSADHQAGVSACLNELISILGRDQRNVGLCLWVEKTPLKWSVEAEFYPLTAEDEDGSEEESEDDESPSTQEPPTGSPGD